MGVKDTVTTKYMRQNEVGEAIDVCLAIEQMNEEAAQNAAQKERISTLQQSVKNLMDNLGLTAEQAMNAIGVSETDRKDILPQTVPKLVRSDSKLHYIVDFYF